MTTRQYAIRMHHDAGDTTFRTAATSREAAVTIILNAELAPRSSVQWVRVQPECDYCDRPATRYGKDSREPLCDIHAREHYRGTVRENVGRLRISGWRTVEAVPDDHPVKVLGPDDPAEDRMTCGNCGRSWDDAVSTSWTPVPAARCPFEYYH